MITYMNGFEPSTDWETSNNESRHQTISYPLDKLNFGRGKIRTFEAQYKQHTPKHFETNEKMLTKTHNPRPKISERNLRQLNLSGEIVQNRNVKATERYQTDIVMSRFKSELFIRVSVFCSTTAS